MNMLGPRKEIKTESQPWRQKTLCFPGLHMTNCSRFSLDIVSFPDWLNLGKGPLLCAPVSLRFLHRRYDPTLLCLDCRLVSSTQLWAPLRAGTIQPSLFGLTCGECSPKICWMNAPFPMDGKFSSTFKPSLLQNDPIWKIPFPDFVSHCSLNVLNLHPNSKLRTLPNKSYHS